MSRFKIVECAQHEPPCFYGVRVERAGTSNHYPERDMAARAISGGMIRGHRKLGKRLGRRSWR